MSKNKYISVERYAGMVDCIKLFFDDCQILSNYRYLYYNNFELLYIIIRRTTFDILTIILSVPVARNQDELIICKIF